MFEVSFFELLVIFIVAIIVIGPQRLPRVACTVGHLIGRLKNYLAQVRIEIDRELDSEQLKGLGSKAESQLRTMRQDYESELQDIESKFKAFPRDEEKISTDIDDKSESAKPR
jgi:sec-independent protein translocase protein TatB